MAVLLTTARIVWFNAAFYGALLLWTAVFLCVSPLLWLGMIALRRSPGVVAARVLVHRYGIVCCLLLKALTPISVRRETEALPQPCIVTPNHQSFFDPYCISFMPLGNLVFLVRSWPFRIPLYGRVMRRVGYMNSDILDADAFMERGAALLRQGVTLIIFPEGTRSRDGRLGRFHVGAFRLAMECGVPVVPLCVSGFNQVFPRGKRFGRPAPAQVAVLAPVYPEAFRRFGERAHKYLQRHVKTVIERELHAVPHHSGPGSGSPDNRA